MKSWLCKHFSLWVYFSRLISSAAPYRRVSVDENSSCVLPFPLTTGGPISRLQGGRAHIPRSPEMSKQIKTNELQCLFDDAVVSAKHSATSALSIHPTVDFSLRSAILPESVLVNADLVSLENQLESVGHQFHRQLVQITYGTYNSLISAVFF